MLRGQRPFDHPRLIKRAETGLKSRQPTEGARDGDRDKRDFKMSAKEASVPDLPLYTLPPTVTCAALANSLNYTQVAECVTDIAWTDVPPSGLCIVYFMTLRTLYIQKGWIFGLIFIRPSHGLVLVNWRRL